MKIFLDLDGPILNVKYRCYKLYVDMLLCGGFDVINMSTYWKMKRNKISEEHIASKTTTSTFAKHYSKKRIDLIENMDYLILDTVSDIVYNTLDKWFFDHSLFLAGYCKSQFLFQTSLSPSRLALWL